MFLSKAEVMVESYLEIKKAFVTDSIPQKPNHKLEILSISNFTSKYLEKES